MEADFSEASPQRFELYGSRLRRPPFTLLPKALYCTGVLLDPPQVGSRWGSEKC